MAAAGSGSARRQAARDGLRLLHTHARPRPHVNPCWRSGCGAPGAAFGWQKRAEKGTKKQNKTKRAIQKNQKEKKLKKYVPKPPKRPLDFAHP